MEKTKEIATNLTNKLFNYSFFTIGNILSNYINFVYTIYNIININFFAYIALT